MKKIMLPFFMMVLSLNVFAQYGYNYGYNGGYLGNMGDMNAVFNSIMQQTMSQYQVCQANMNEVYNQLLNQTMENVNRQNQIDYQNFVKATGSDMSFEDWYSMKAWAYCESQQASCSYGDNGSSSSYSSNYRQSYHKWEQIVKENIETLKNISGYTNQSQMRSLIRDAQKSMRAIRMEAANAGVSIAVSPWENTSF